MTFSLPEKMVQILTPEGQIVGDLPKVPDERLLEFYRWMVFGRTFSDRAVALQRQGRLGTLAPINGQEATSVGIAAPLEAQDWLTGSYREVLAYMMKGVEPASILHFYQGQPSDESFAQARCLSVQIVLATQMLHAVGLAMAIKYERKPQVVVGVCGDGATSEGDFNEALNFAAVYQAPVVFVIQNNGWAISVPRHQQTAAQYIAHRGPGFGVPSYVVDGNDVLAVYQLMTDCIAKARAGGGPSLIEAITYRLGAHTTADDPTKYRPDAEYQSWVERDPISRYRRFLLNRQLLSEADVTLYNEEARTRVQAAVEALDAKPPLDPAHLFDLVYAEPTPQLRRQKAAFLQEVNR